MPRTTSAAAATATHKSGSAASQRLRVLKHLLGKGTNGATLEELSHELEIVVQSVCPRRLELEKLGYVTDSGRRRNTVQGKAAIVWVVPDFVIGSAKDLVASQ